MRRAVPLLLAILAVTTAASLTLTAAEQPARTREDGDPEILVNIWSHRKLAAVQEHLQAKAKESQVDQSGFLILLGSSLVFVAVIICCGFFCCKSPQVKDDELYKPATPQAVQLQYRGTPFKFYGNVSSASRSLPPSEHSPKPPLPHGSSGRTASGWSSTPKSVRVSRENSSVRAPGTPPYALETLFEQPSTLTDKSSTRPPRTPSSGSSGCDKALRPDLGGPSRSSELRQMPVVAGYHHQGVPLESPWAHSAPSTVDQSKGSEHPPAVSSAQREDPSALKEQEKASNELKHSSGDLMGRAESEDVVPYPPAFGRRCTFIRDSRRANEFSAEQEEKAAGALERAAGFSHQTFLKEFPEAAELPELTVESTRVPLSEVKLKVKDGEPVLLGRGAFGQVLLGSIHKETCAVKTILEGSRKEQARFLREIKLLRIMHSQHITRYMGWSVCPEGFVLLMEYMPGGTLSDALQSDESQYQYYKRGKEAMLSVAVALCHLHSKRISHFDVKCVNILLDKDGQAKLADVGLGKFLKQDDTVVTRTGTPAYAAPEQQYGKNAGTAADIWAFGVTLWEVCTCEKPPRNRNLRNIDVPEEAPQEVVDLIDVCLTVDVRKRPVAVDVHDMLQACPWPESAAQREAN